MQLRLKELRLEKNLTQEKLAEAVGCSKGAYSKYETGKRDPSIILLIRLADYFGVSVDYILGREVNPFSALTGKEIELIKKLRGSNLAVKESIPDIIDTLSYNYKAFSGNIGSKK